MADPKEHLHMDRRLLRRRGWISDEERDAHLAGLPDVGEKGEYVDLPGSQGDAAAEAPSEPAADPGPGGTEPGLG